MLQFFFSGDIITLNHPCKVNVNYQYLKYLLSLETRECSSTEIEPYIVISVHLYWDWRLCFNGNLVYLKIICAIQYSVMQSDRNTLKLNVVLTKFLCRHYRIMGSKRHRKSMIEIYFKLLFSEHVKTCCSFVVGSQKVAVQNTFPI